MTIKKWGSERYRQVLVKLSTDYSVFPIFLGGEADFVDSEYVLGHMNEGMNLCGSSSVQESLKIMEACDIFFGNDTGPMHMANCVGLPCFVIFSEIDASYKWEPFGDRHTVLRRWVHCRGCQLRTCGKSSTCMDLIKVDEVYVSLKGFLKKFERIIS